MSRHSQLQSGHDFMQKALSHIGQLAEEINRSGWDMEDDLSDVLMGFSSDVGRGPSESADTVDKLAFAVSEFGHVLAGAAEQEALLEDQTASARAVAKKCMLDLTVSESARTKAESANEKAVTIADAQSLELHNLKQQIVVAEASVAAHVSREGRLLESASECERLQLHCEQLVSADASLKTQLTEARETAAAATVVGTLAASKTEALVQEVAGLKEQVLLAAAAASKTAIEESEAKWLVKYAALEEEYKSIEPRYQESAKQQRGRIRVLERELSMSEQKQKVVAEELVADLERSMNRANERIAELENAVHDADSMREQLQMATAEQKESHENRVTAERAAVFLRARVDQLESELSHSIQLRTSSVDTLTAHSKSLKCAEKNASATIATLLTSMGMPARSASWNPKTVTYKPTDLGGTRTLPIVESARDTIGTEEDKENSVPVTTGDVVVAVCGQLIHELKYDEISEILKGYGEYTREVVVSDEGSVQMIDAENDDTEDESEEEDDTADGSPVDPTLIEQLYQSWLAQQQNPSSSSEDIANETFFRNQLSERIEQAGNRVSAQLMEKVASAVLE